MVEFTDLSRHLPDLGSQLMQVSSLLAQLTPPDISPLERQSTNADGAFIQRALSVVFVVIGAISVMMIVIGGIKFAGSQGDPQGVSKAKNTVIYAIVGLVVAILATVIVDLVIGRVVG